MLRQCGRVGVVEDEGGGQAQAGDGVEAVAQFELGGPVGGGETVAGAVLVDRRAAHDREDPVAVAAGVRQPLQQQHAHALGHAHAVGRVGERLAPAVAGQALLTAELHQARRVRHDRGAARQGHGALAVAQGLHGEVERHQGGGAGRVEGDGRTLQAERVGDAPGQHGGHRAGEDVALGAGRTAQVTAVALARRADEHSGGAARDGRRVDARTLERLPGGLEQEPLLRVHGQRLARRDAEEARVEVARVVQEAAFERVDLARRGRVGVVQVLDVPAAVGREARDGVAARGQEVPQVLGRGDAARKAAAHGDDRDRLRFPRFDVSKVLASLLQLGDHTGQVFPQLLFVRHRNVAPVGSDSR